MQKNIVLVLLLSALGILMAMPGLPQEDIEVLEDPGFAMRQRPPAVFKHDEHNENAAIEECNECHHIYENGAKLEDESSEDQLCSDCHSENGSGDRPRLAKAFHLNCKGCHLQNNKGPIMCGECHVR
jgi:hypothetical protein